MSINPSSATPGVPGSQRLNRLWIGGLPRNVSIDDVRLEVNRVYSSFGPVADVCVITTARDVMCFVQYEDEQVACRAREDTNGKMILGSVIKVNYAVVRGPDAPRQPPARPGEAVAEAGSGKAPRDPNSRMVIVSNLPEDMSADELAEIVRPISEDVSFVNVWLDGSKKLGVLTFDTSRGAKRLNRRLNGAIIEGARLKLQTFSFDEYNQSVKRSRSNSRRRR